MSDFNQGGVVPTLHDLGNKPVAALEDDLRVWSVDLPITLIIPSLSSEIDSPALDGIVSQLAGADYLDTVLVGLDEADEQQFRNACEVFDRLPQRHAVLWNDGPLIRQLGGALAERGLAPVQSGKGSNVWFCLGAVLAEGRAGIVALHDADIIDYDRSMLARLVYPVVHPRFGYGYAKGFYPRVSGNRLCGRVTRLLIEPLLRALRNVVGDQPYLRFLRGFRYPLAGESAMALNVAARLRIPGHWGLEIGILSEVYHQQDQASVCQVDIAAGYDHKHQDLSAEDPNAGLRRMATDIVATVMRHLDVDGTEVDAGALDRLRDEYLGEARVLIRHYANDAELNGYIVDVADEESTAEVFALSVVEGGLLFMDDPLERVFNPAWQQVNACLPEAPSLLVAAVAAGCST